jgi:hypothetical protein
MADKKEEGILDLLLKGEFAKAAGVVGDKLFDFMKNDGKDFLLKNSIGHAIVGGAVAGLWGGPFLGILGGIAGLMISKYAKGDLSNVFNTSSGAQTPKPGQTPAGPSGPANG